MTRVLTHSVLDTPLPHEPLPADTVQAGSPTAGAVALWESGDVEVGIWEMSAGVATDVEVEEVFVVVAGRGEVTLADGSALALAPGAVVHLSAGERTTWRIDEPLRKVYVARG